jgi:hypothetical protein
MTGTRLTMGAQGLGKDIIVTKLASTRPLLVIIN